MNYRYGSSVFSNYSQTGQMKPRHPCGSQRGRMVDIIPNYSLCYILNYNMLYVTIIYNLTFFQSCQLLITIHVQYYISIEFNIRLFCSHRGVRSLIKVQYYDGSTNIMILLTVIW